MPPQLSRRSFVAAGAALVAAAACGNDEPDGSAQATTTTEDPATAPDQLEVVIGTAQLIAGIDNRVTMGVLQDATPLKGDAVELAFGPRDGRLGAPQPATYHHEGIADRPYYRTQFRFPSAGEWVIAAKSGNKTGAAFVSVIERNATQVPNVGDPMIPVATPTTADARGVNPICTRQPVCPLHDVSLDAALAEKRPLVAIFGTPALCQSKVCGPVLDILLGQMTPFADRVRVVHVEVFKSLDTDFSADDLTDGMQAYHLTFEPVVFFAGADGRIRERLDGPYDALECREALTRLVTP